LFYLKQYDHENILWVIFLSVMLAMGLVIVTLDIVLGVANQTLSKPVGCQSSGRLCLASSGTSYIFYFKKKTNEIWVAGR